MKATDGTRTLEMGLEGQGLEQVKECVYLGSTVTETTQSERKLIFGYQKQQQSLSRLMIILRSRNIKIKTTNPTPFCQFNQDKDN